MGGAVLWFGAQGSRNGKISNVVCRRFQASDRAICYAPFHAFLHGDVCSFRYSCGCEFGSAQWIFCSCNNCLLESSFRR